MRYSTLTPGAAGLLVGLIVAGIGYQQGWPLWVVILTGLIYGFIALMLVLLLRIWQGIWQASRNKRG